MRDHAHRALRAVVEVVHDGMESHLRSIIGCWVAGMCDSYAPSATSARLAFETAFSAEKQEELYRVMMKPIIQVQHCTHVCTCVVFMMYSIHMCNSGHLCTTMYIIYVCTVPIQLSNWRVLLDIVHTKSLYVCK